MVTEVVSESLQHSNDRLC